MRDKTVVVGMMLTMTAMPLFAQTAVPTGDPTVGPTTAGAAPGLEEIIVTAQRRAESLQNVPVAISAFTARERDRIGLNSIQEIAAFTPGFSYQDYPNRATLRGVGRLTNALGSDPGVAVYVDGVYTSETSPIGNFPLFVDRVEVLRGPQGTLFGRNSIGGAVNTISRRPAKNWSGEARLVVAEYETFQPQATLSGPITPWLRFRVGGVYDYAGSGWVRNVNGGKGLGTRDDYFIQAQLEADLGSRATLWLKYDTARWDRSSPVQVQNAPYLTSAYFPANSLVPNPTFGDPTPNPAATNPRRVNLDDTGYARLRNNHGVTGILTYDLEADWQVKYTGNYQQFDYTSLSDYDQAARESYNFAGYTIGSRLLVFIGDAKKTYSNELTLSGKTGGFNVIVGAYQYHEKETQPFRISDPNQPQLAAPLVPPTFAPGDPNPGRLAYEQLGVVRASSWAAFGQADLKTGDFSLTLGARYTHDSKVGSEFYRIYFYEPFTLAGIAPVLATCCSLQVNPPVNRRTLNRSFEGVTARAALSWQPDADTLVYASVANGYKAGGFNLGQVAANAVVNPEKALALETGVKLSVARSLRLNGALFYNEYYDLQSLVNVIRNNVLQQDFVNARRARALGVELEATWQPVDPLTLTLAYSYLDAKFVRFCCAVDVASATPTLPIDLAGNRLPQSPRHKLAVNAAYGLDTDIGRLTALATWAFVDRQYYAPFTTPAYEGRASDRTDFRLTLQSKNSRFTGIVFVKNAFDTVAVNALQLGPAGVGLPRLITPSPPRSFGAEVQVRF